jgi:hypothetical protein
MSGTVKEQLEELVVEGKVIPIKKRKKVAILGTVPHKLKAFVPRKDFNPDEFEIWAIAHACLGDPLPRADRIFEIHKWDEVVKWGSPQAWALFPNAPVYLQEARPDVPHSIAFPFDEIAAQFNIFPDRKESNMSNSISWMIALAITEGFEEIHVYGVNMSHHTEYGTQKPSCEYYLGLAKGMGKAIYVPAESDLMKSYFLYGKDEEKQTEILKRIQDHMDFMTTQFNGQKQQSEQLRDSLNQHIGGIETCKFFLGILKH